MTRTIAVVTGSRADYGLLLPVMRAIDAQRGLRLATVVTGLHWVTGTWRGIEFPIDAKVRMQVSGFADKSGREADVAAVGRGVAGLGKAFARLKPDVVVVLGDRIEAFAAATAASVGGIRLAHIHGGDRAEGVADEAMRHAISKLAHVHFAASVQSRQRLVRMGEAARWVFNVGSPAVDGLKQMPAADDATLREMGLNPEERFIVVMQHPSGAAAAQEQRWMAATLKATERFGRVVMSPNRDPGCAGVWRALRAAKVKPIEHLPRAGFVGLLKRASALVGNSSAGLIEAAAARPAGVAAVNIGRRQDGREKPGNVIDCEPTVAAIRAALGRAMRRRQKVLKHPYGNGRAGERIAARLAGLDLDKLAVRKRNAY